MGRDILERKMDKFLPSLCMSNKARTRMQSLEFLARLLDSQFKIPGTNIRFGLDAIIGLVPGVGDLSTFAVSSYMIVVMARNGVSGYVLARMVLNILIDTIIGSIPLIGDLFDVAFKANLKNMRLLKEHYVEERHQGSALKVIIPVLSIVLILIIVMTYLCYKLIAELAHMF